MRIQNNNNFATRPTEKMYEMPKYFLIYEGESTEPVYFDGIVVNRSKLALNQSLSIISVLRSIEDLSNSHPKYAIKMANEIMISSSEDIITKENLLKSIKDYLIANNIEDNELLIEQAEDYINNYAADEINYSEIRNIVVDIYKDEVFDKLADNISNYLEMQKNILDYNPEIDVINLVVDRDKGNFKEEQYNNLIKECNDKSIKLYVSNPCFEVWLLMHFDEFEKLDFNKLLENKRVNSNKNSRKYADKMLSEIIGYDKSNLNFDDFIDKIDSAIEREKKYCEDVTELKDNIGSNVGILITNMRN